MIGINTILKWKLTFVQTSRFIDVTSDNDSKHALQENTIGLMESQSDKNSGCYGNICTMQGDTCPTERCISKGRSANLRLRLTSSDWLKVDFWIHSPVTADISYSERLLFVGLPLCDVSAATGPCIKKSTFNQNQNVITARDKFAEWPLVMYPSAGHNIALHSVIVAIEL